VECVISIPAACSRGQPLAVGRVWLAPCSCPSLLSRTDFEAGPHSSRLATCPVLFPSFKRGCCVCCWRSAARRGLRPPGWLPSMPTSPHTPCCPSCSTTDGLEQDSPALGGGQPNRGAGQGRGRGRRAGKRRLRWCRGGGTGSGSWRPWQTGRQPRDTRCSGEDGRQDLPHGWAGRQSTRVS
jgi:hypothetical protein